MQEFILDASLVISLLVITLILSGEYYKRVNIQRPSIGHLNWRDLVFAMVLIVGVPYIYLAMPIWAVTLIFALILISLMYNSLSPIIGVYSAVLAIALTIAQFFLASQWLSNLICIVAFASLGPIFIKNGLQPNEVAAFSVALMIYDIIAVFGTDLMQQLVNILISQPYFIGLRFNSALIGGGDIALLSIFVATTLKNYGWRNSLLMIAALVFPSVVILLIAALYNVLMLLPYLVFATPIYLLTYYGIIARFSTKSPP